MENMLSQLLSSEQILTKVNIEETFLIFPLIDVYFTRTDWKI